MQKILLYYMVICHEFEGMKKSIDKMYLQGAAAFWYNLYRSGDGIFDTRHAACPVLVGQKWVSNKWIHERGQEFRRPCSVNMDEQYRLLGANKELQKFQRTC